MKLFFTLFAAAVLASLAGCAPTSSGGDLFASGRDARVYNAATGRYEWTKEEEAPRRPNKAAAIRSAMEPAPAAPAAEGRAYNLEKGRYESPAGQ